MPRIPRRRGNSRRRPRPPSEVLSAAWCRRAAVLRVRPPSRCAAAAVSATCASTGAMCGGLRDAGRLMGSARARTAPGCPKNGPSALAGGRAALPAPRLSSSTTGKPSRVAIISLLRALRALCACPHDVTYASIWSFTRFRASHDLRDTSAVSEKTQYLCSGRARGHEALRQAQTDGPRRRRNIAAP